jgi:hypothetical protein
MVALSARSTRVNAASNFPKCAEVKFLSWWVSVISRPCSDRELHFCAGRVHVVLRPVAWIDDVIDPSKFKAKPKK